MASPSASGPPPFDSDFQSWLAACRERVDRALDRVLPRAEGRLTKIASAMRYAVLGGGKRVRPALAIAAFESCGGAGHEILDPAAALELVHAYSLVHDDLPAMDDDDLRRGKPTLHRAFDEATAVLAGDALLTLAFEILATYPAGPVSAPRRAEAVAVVAAGAGAAGMVGGQAGDLDAERREISRDELEWIHRHKTGALFAASAELGAVHAGASSEVRGALAAYGEKLGLAFQVADDVLDCTATAEQIGKTPGKDQRAGKATYPALLGLRESRMLASRLIDEALSGLGAAGVDSPPLRQLARQAVSRTR